MILVVGATGHVRSLVVRRLRAAGETVRAVVHDPATADDLAATGAELVVADLRIPETLDAAWTVSPLWCRPPMPSRPAAVATAPMPSTRATPS